MYRRWLVHVHRDPKKQALALLNCQTVTDFQNPFTDRLGKKICHKTVIKLLTTPHISFKNSILQGSVATPFRCGGRFNHFNDSFVANFLPSLSRAVDLAGTKRWCSERRLMSPGASIPMGQGGHVPPTGGTRPPNIWSGGHYHECPPQYFWSNISNFLSMQCFLDKLEVFSLDSYRGPT